MAPSAIVVNLARRLSCPTHYPKEAYKPGVKEKIIDLALDGVGIRATSRLLGMDQNTVMSTLLKKNR